MTPLTLKCDNPSIECGDLRLQVVGTVNIETAPEHVLQLADAIRQVGLLDKFDGNGKPVKRKALTGGEK